MPDNKSPRRESIDLSRLRPTQFTVGMREVKFKRKHLRLLERRPAELVNYILLTPIRVVLGPANKAYVIDHHHLGLALLKEHFESAPMDVVADFSKLSPPAFWKRMQRENFLHLVNAKGIPKPLDDLPKRLTRLKDDPYRSLAGFVRLAGGYAKTQTPFAEFTWADFYRPRIKAKSLHQEFDAAVKKGVRMAKSAAAKGLPGYLGAGAAASGT
jgi:hypothetical protein